ncbi:MAG: Glu/Leu/Phe/Val dehydrogenase [Sedimentisphaeraceae bacterium JB056]
MVKDTILNISRYNLEKSAQRTGLSRSIFDKIAFPKEMIELRLSPILSDGKIANIEAYIVRYNDILGPSKGGIRMIPEVTLDDVAGLAMEMTWKTSLVGVPFGGGKSGIRFDSQSVNPEDKEIIIRAFARSAARHMGPELYVPAPDMGTNERDMGHIRDCISYSQGISITRGCFVTGKPIILGGIPGRRQATGRGVIYTTAAACEKLGLSFEGLEIVIQGFGNVGCEAAIEAAVRGAKIIAVADVNAAVFNQNGLDVKALAQYAADNRTVEGFAGGQELNKDDIFAIKCDCLIPAAAGSQITVNNASDIRAKLIAEGANAPTTPDADDILNKKGIFIIPDILCNAGGVFVSYLEYVQETQHEQMTEQQVNQRLLERMTKCFNDVYEYSKQHKLEMRQAAMDIAVSRVVEGVKARGLLP